MGPLDGPLDLVLHRLFQAATNGTLRFVQARLDSIWPKPPAPGIPKLSVAPYHCPCHGDLVMAAYTLHLTPNPTPPCPTGGSLSVVLTVNGTAQAAVPVDPATTDFAFPGTVQDTDSGSVALTFSNPHGGAGPTTTVAFTVADLIANLTPPAPGVPLLFVSPA
jgi:hypothetical protein